MTGMGEDQRYWFKAKRYGWGWSPSTWEGWLVTVGYVAIVAAPYLVGRRVGVPLGLVGLLVGTPLVLWLCVTRGEPPRWRWGRHG